MTSNFEVVSYFHADMLAWLFSREAAQLQRRVCAFISSCLFPYQLQRIDSEATSEETLMFSGVTAAEGRFALPN